MNRRKFLQAVGLGTAAVAATPALALVPETSGTPITLGDAISVRGGADIECLRIGDKFTIDGYSKTFTVTDIVMSSRPEWCCTITT